MQTNLTEQAAVAAARPAHEPDAKADPLAWALFHLHLLHFEEAQTIPRDHEAGMRREVRMSAYEQALDVLRVARARSVA